jgi:hypothetical protein
LACDMPKGRSRLCRRNWACANQVDHGRSRYERGTNPGQHFRAVKHRGPVRTQPNGHPVGCSRMLQSDYSGSHGRYVALPLTATSPRPATALDASVAEAAALDPPSGSFPRQRPLAATSPPSCDAKSTQWPRNSTPAERPARPLRVAGVPVPCQAGEVPRSLAWLWHRTMRDFCVQPDVVEMASEGP